MKEPVNKEVYIEGEDFETLNYYQVINDDAKGVTVKPFEYDFSDDITIGNTVFHKVPDQGVVVTLKQDDVKHFDVAAEDIESGFDFSKQFGLYRTMYENAKLREGLLTIKDHLTDKLHRAMKADMGMGTVADRLFSETVIELQLVLDMIGKVVADVEGIDSMLRMSTDEEECK